MIIYLLLLILSFTLTYIIKNYYIKNAILEEVNERSSHTVPTPHGGGIAIVITWFVGLVYLNYVNEIDATLFYALMVGVVISVVSYFDDIYELSPKLRLGVQLAVALGALVALGGLNTLDFGIFTITNDIVTNTIAIVAIIWYINLYNFLDGINGYAGSEAIFLSIAGLLIFGGAHFGVLAVAVLGFLYWNWNKAKIFMGDVGSTLLGYNVAIFTLYYVNQDSMNLWIWIVLFSVFWFDATLTLIRRKLNGEKLSQAHKKHGYQRLNQSGWSHYKVTNYSIVVNVCIFILLYIGIQLDLIFVSFVMVLTSLYGIMKFIDKKKAFK